MSETEVKQNVRPILDDIQPPKDYKVIYLNDNVTTFEFVTDNKGPTITTNPKPGDRLGLNSSIGYNCQDPADSSTKLSVLSVINPCSERSAKAVCPNGFLSPWVALVFGSVFNAL